MSCWVKADYRFDNRCATFYVTHKHMIIERVVFSLLNQCNDPVGLENSVLNLVQKYRPELAGCVLFCMGFDGSRQQWEFCVSHGSLPPVPMGTKVPSRPLDPAYERDNYQMSILKEVEVGA